MNQREIDEMYTYLLEFTADVLYCAAPYSEDRKVLAALTYDPDFKQNFLLSYRNEQDTMKLGYLYLNNIHQKTYKMNG